MNHRSVQKNHTQAGEGNVNYGWKIVTLQLHDWFILFTQQWCDHKRHHFLGVIRPDILAPHDNFFPTLDSPIPRQRRPMIRYFREDVNAPWNGLGCFPGQSKNRSLPSPVSSTTASSRCTVCFIPRNWFFLLQPQNPKHLTFLLAAVRFRQDQVVVCGRCHLHLALERVSLQLSSAGSYGKLTISKH